MYDVAHKAINIDSPKQRKPAYPITDKLAFSVLNKHLINELYSSTTFAKLNDPECGLYYQSAVYIFQFLKSEIETGKVA